MKKIGFIDYYLSEWHANTYPARLEKIIAEKGYDYKLCYAWAEKHTSLVDGVTTQEWCEKYGVENCVTIEELCEKSDLIFVLAPSNPEKHLQYAKIVLKYQKPTYIDKPFAPNAEQAKEIFALAEEYGTPFFSTSALRYVKELDSFQNCRSISTLGSGADVEEYIIHQAEMVVKKLGIGAKRVKATNIGDYESFLKVEYNDDRVASMHFIRGGAPFVASVFERESDNGEYCELHTNVFNELLADVLRFAETRVVSFDVAETLEVNRILEACVTASHTPEEWIEIADV